jgi:hypothetical protein
MSGNSTSVIDSTHCRNKAILCSGNNDVEHIHEVHNSLDYEILNLSVDTIRAWV